MKTKNPNYTFAILSLSGIATVVVGCLLGLQWIRPKYYTVLGDSKKQYTRDNPLSLRPLLDREIIYDTDSNPLMTISLTYNKKIQCVREKKPIQPDGNIYRIEVEDSFLNHTYQIEVAPLTNTIVRSGPDISSSDFDSF